jgi:hypothetical protein
MSNAATCSALNQLLIDLGRSLLQYVGECWPWAGAKTQEAQRQIDELVQIQKRQVGELAELLDEAEWTIDKGTYPTEYTDLHYVALSYLLDQLIQNQRELVDEAKRTLAACQGDPEARALVSEVQTTQQKILKDLEILARTTAQDSTRFG